MEYSASIATFTEGGNVYPDVDLMPYYIEGNSALDGTYWPPMYTETTKLKFPKSTFTTVYKEDYPVERLLESLDGYNLMVDKYNDDITKYKKAKTAYDKQVAA